MKRVGFTGTSAGMTEAQKWTFLRLTGEVRPDEFHHGDATGADAEAHNLVWTSSFRPKVVIHPPPDDKGRAFCAGDEVRERKGHFARNRTIVDETDLLIGCPPAMHELEEGGTWYTLRYARKKGRPFIVVWPDGTETRENHAQG